MVEILNRDRLEIWLKDQPREVAIAIAARCALRVFPSVAEYTQDQAAHVASSLILPVFRALAVSWVAGAWPLYYRKLQAAAASAAADANAAASGADFATADDDPMLPAAYMGYAAANAADAAAYDTDAAARAAANAASDAEIAAEFDGASIWSGISADASFIREKNTSTELIGLPLWQNGTLNTSR